MPNLVVVNHTTLLLFVHQTWRLGTSTHPNQRFGVRVKVFNLIVIWIVNLSAEYVYLFGDLSQKSDVLRYTGYCQIRTVKKLLWRTIFDSQEQLEK